MSELTIWENVIIILVVIINLRPSWLPTFTICSVLESHDPPVSPPHSFVSRGGGHGRTDTTNWENQRIDRSLIRKTRQTVQLSIQIDEHC